MAKNMSKRKFSTFPPSPEKKNDNEAKNESHHDNPWNLLYITSNTSRSLHNHPLLLNWQIWYVLFQPTLSTDETISKFVYNYRKHVTRVGQKVLPPSL